MFFGYNALSVEEQTDVAGFSVLFSLKVFSPEIMQILLEIDWQPCHATSEDFPPAVDSWPVAFETRGVFTKRKKPPDKIMYLKHSDNCNDAFFSPKVVIFQPSEMRM